MTFAGSLSSTCWNVFTLCLGLTLRLAVMEPLDGAPWVSALFAPLGFSAEAANFAMLCVATLVTFGLTTICGLSIRSARTIPPSARPIFVLPLGALDGTRVPQTAAASLADARSPNRTATQARSSTVSS